MTLSIYDSFLLAWDSVPISEQSLRSFQHRIVKRENDLKALEGQSDVQLEQAFYSKSAQPSSSADLTTQQKKMKALKLEKLKKKSRCNNCGRSGHFARECPYPPCSPESEHEEDSRYPQCKDTKKNLRRNTCR